MPYRTVLLGLISLVVVAAPVGAQVNLYDEPLGTLYVSWYPDRYEETNSLELIPRAVPFSLYLVAEIDFAGIGAPDQNVSNGLSAWEASVEFPVDWFILATETYPETSIDFGSTSENVSNYLVGTGSPVPAGEPFALVRWTILASGRSLLPFSLTPGAVTTTPSVAGSAAWLEAEPANGCTINEQPAPCLFRFNVAPSDWIPGRATEATSFGAMKARYE